MLDTRTFISQRNVNEPIDNDYAMLTVLKILVNWQHVEGYILISLQG